MARQRARSGKHERHARALAAQRHLTEIMLHPELHPKEVVESAAVHLMKTSRRHRLYLPPQGRELVCRACWANHVYSSQFRVRIKAGQRIKTCLVCNSVRRFGAGPKAHRRT
jgi:RNase P subunit RPR2